MRFSIQELSEIMLIIRLKSVQRCRNRATMRCVSQREDGHPYSKLFTFTIIKTLSEVIVINGLDL